ncbi:OmpA family protein [Archangium violaceum]|uniref:OmpA family protein n=1 Tax=Archangium violaceum TaxID=83451 RepID=UPI001951E132|nr:OmpA family protein [Archangium violaceum]QRN98416.1 OmpA family protein [Archangium violaceum]
MKRSGSFALAFVLALAAASASAQDARFDVQSFRPLGAPQDLVVVGQSRPLSHLSISGGAFLNFALDPLVLVAAGTHSKAVSVVGNRLQLDVMAAVGLFDWIELGLDMPLVLAQGSDNLEAIGTEGFIQSFAPGDLRLTAKVAVPGLRRAAEGSGLGASLTFGLGLPTGIQDAFTSDGDLTYTPGLLLDYRFESGILLSLNTGVWLRPDRQFAGVQWGNAATFGLGAEVPVLRSSGITALGTLTGSMPLDKLPDSALQIPAEFLLGLRWYSSTGLTFTVGGGGGCGCSLTVPTLRVFTSIVWVPGKTREWEALERFKKPPEPPVDPDGDSVIGEGDRCPSIAGLVENGGCPDSDADNDAVVDRLDRCPAEAGLVDNGGCPDPDTDKDAVVDRLDRCPDVPQGPRGRDGCPLAHIKGNKILILDQVHFATGQDIILPESFPILEEVGQILIDHREIQRVLVEAHTDARASDTYNFDLSRRRAASVMNYLLDTGVAVERLCSAGFGRSRPVGDNNTEEGMALNRRVEFTIQPPAQGALPPCPPDPSAEQEPSSMKKGRRLPAEQKAAAPLP